MKPYNGFSAAQRMEAFKWLKGEIAAGRRAPVPQRCDACGQERGILEWHSENYGAPFGGHIGQFGLCYVCHMMIHCRFRSPHPWRAYRKAVEAGARFGPMYSRHFQAFAGVFLQLPLPEPKHWGPIPERRVLEEIEEGVHLPPGHKPGQYVK